MNPDFSTNTASTSSTNTFQLLNVPTKLNNAHFLIQASRQEKPTTMPDGFIPSDSDVCCGRGKQHWNMTGNINFRKVIRASVARYLAAPLKTDKTAVVVSIVNKIRRQGGHFLKQDSSGRWYDIGDVTAHDKVSHSLRDQAASSASSAAKSLLQQVKKEQIRRTAAGVGTRDFPDAASVCDSVDTAAAVVAGLTETETESPSLSSLSPSSPFSCIEELIIDLPPMTTLNRGR